MSLMLSIVRLRVHRYELGLLEWVRAYDAHRDLQGACASLIQVRLRARPFLHRCLVHCRCLANGSNLVDLLLCLLELLREFHCLSARTGVSIHHLSAKTAQIAWRQHRLDVDFDTGRKVCLMLICHDGMPKRAVRNREPAMCGRVDASSECVSA